LLFAFALCFLLLLIANCFFLEPPMSCPICTFRKPDGVRCGSPALYGHNYCYFHTRGYRDAMHGARARRRYSTVRFALPPLGDMRSIQDVLSQLVGALAADTIDYRRATAMLSALRMASRELRNPTEW
jgi:hypothetical protein